MKTGFFRVFKNMLILVLWNLFFNWWIWIVFRKRIQRNLDEYDGRREGW